MIFHDSHEITYLILVKKLGKIFQNLSFAAVVIGASRAMKVLVENLSHKYVNAYRLWTPLCSS